MQHEEGHHGKGGLCGAWRGGWAWRGEFKPWLPTFSPVTGQVARRSELLQAPGWQGLAGGPAAGVREPLCTGLGWFLHVRTRKRLLLLRYCVAEQSLLETGTWGLPDPQTERVWQEPGAGLCPGEEGRGVGGGLRGSPQRSRLPGLPAGAAACWEVQGGWYITKGHQ